MPTFDLPDVYSEEIKPTGAPVKAVGAGTVALVGKFKSGTALTPTRVGNFDQLMENFGGLAIGSAAYDAYWCFKNKCPAMVIVKVEGVAANVTLVDRQGVPADKIKVTALVDGTFANYDAGPPKVGIQVVIADGTISNTFKATFNYYYAEKGVDTSFSEEFDNLSIDTTATRYFVTIINTGSNMVKVEDLAPLNVTPPGHLPATGTFALTSGSEPDYAAGFTALEQEDDVNIVIADKDDSITRGLLIDHCDAMTDRQSVLNPEQYMTVAEVKAIGDALDTDRGVLTYPWRVAYDPVMKLAHSFRPAGFRAGLMARIDVYRSPCNFKEYGVSDLERKLSRADLVSLQDSKISPTYWWGTRGIRVRNGINLSSDANLFQVFRRRMADWIIESVEDSFGWAVSLSNSEPNRNAIVSSITGWFRDLKNAEWIEGFYVKDKTDETAKSARKAVFRYGVKLFNVMDYIHFQAEVGENVVVEEV